MKKILGILSALLVTACSGALFTAANIGNESTNWLKFADITFDRDTQLKLDLYKPNFASANTPTVIFFYGGGWTEGDKSQYAFVADRLARDGYAVIVPNYRKYPDVKFPTFIKDSAKAVDWAQLHLKDYKLDADNLFIMGHSAGAHTATLVASDPQYLQSNVKFRGILGLSGPYDFTPKEEPYTKIFGPKSEYPKMRVPNYITGKEAPMLLIHGTDDTTVGQFNAENLALKINEKGGKVTTHYIKGVDHVGTLSPFSSTLSSDSPIPGYVLEFLEANKR